MSERLHSRLRRIEGAMARERRADKMLRLGRLWRKLLDRMSRNRA